jgi:molybdopterin synthase sulfur carrier subunit
MRITVRYFASLREALGAGEAVDAPDGQTLTSLRDQLIARGEPHASALARHRAVRCAVDQRVVDESTVLRDGAEVAFFPPVTGG